MLRKRRKKKREMKRDVKKRVDNLDRVNREYNLISTFWISYYSLLSVF